MKNPTGWIFRVLLLIGIALAVIGMATGCRSYNVEYCRHRVLSVATACMDAGNDKRPWHDEGGPKRVRLAWFQNLHGANKHIEAEVMSPDGEVFYVQDAYQGGQWLCPVDDYVSQYRVIKYVTVDEWFKIVKKSRDKKLK